MLDLSKESYPVFGSEARDSIFFAPKDSLTDACELVSKGWGSVALGERRVGRASGRFRVSALEISTHERPT